MTEAPEIYPTREDLLRSPIGLLVHAKALPLFNQRLLSCAVQQFLPFIYPEGTIEFSVSSDEELREFSERYLRYSSDIPDWPLTTGLWFRNQVSFPLRRYWIEFRRDYLEPIRDRGVGIGMAGGTLKWYPGEKKLDDLLMAVLFHRNPSKKTKSRLVDCISTWFDAVKDGGIDGEGPAFPAIRHVKLHGRRAELRLNASRTGPRTLLWLLLEILKVAHDVSRIEVICFNPDDPVAIEHELQGIRSAFKLMGRKWTEQDERKHLIARRGGPDSEAEILLLR